ncbi:response regulator [Capillimicrobium parvum]|uniref:Transcriptional regulatory protein NarL n=1 Tax=Capillimicrobium parvum TaxID=2884022 RepID=A0A9E7BZJ8_9ACTN|nr:response regulator transcription factor [Capillimicrobium parvum]UGS34619.1 putative transcriptional regulatory protein NarL [Capillimicrobium parvum]
MSVEPNSRQSRQVRVVVADDDPLVRTAVRRAVTGDSRIRVEGEATNAHQALDLIRRLRPDVILLDSDLPGPDLISITRRIHGVAPDVGVVVFANGSDDEQALLGLRAGAVGILGKGVPMDALARSLIAVKRGEAPIPRRLSAALMRRVRETPASGLGLRPVRSTLTAREWQVMDLMSAGESTAAIAKQLAVSVETVRSHMRSVFLKFGVHSREEAVDACRRLRA